MPDLLIPVEFEAIWEERNVAVERRLCLPMFRQDHSVWFRKFEFEATKFLRIGVYERKWLFLKISSTMKSGFMDKHNLAGKDRVTMENGSMKLKMRHEEIHASWPTFAMLCIGQGNYISINWILKNLDFMKAFSRE